MALGKAWLSGRDHRGQRFVLLARRACRIVALDAGRLAWSEDSRGFALDGRDYARIEDDDTLFFWDELRDDAGRTVGYAFAPPGHPRFVRSDWLCDSENVAGTEAEGEVAVLLRPCVAPRREVLRAFGAELFVASDDPRDCAVLLYDWSKNPVGFEVIDPGSPWASS